MKIYDCFLFFNELELLELRLMTLYDVVDHFVLVEAGTTFSGNPKELYFENNKFLFEKYLNKIIHIKADNLPNAKDLVSQENAWKNEFYNRNLISNGLIQANNDDYIVVSDVDEIPNPQTLLYGINNNYDIFSLEQKLFYYYVNCLQNQKWYGSVAIKKKYMKTPNSVRDTRNVNVINLSNGGWHYSFLGNKDRIKLKIESYVYANTQKNISDDGEHILKCLETGGDLFKRNEDMFKKKFVSLEEVNHPNLNKWLIKYPNFFKT